MPPWLGLLPPLLAFLYAGWCGNLLGGVTAAGSSVAAAVLLAMIAFAGPPPDALRLGRAGQAWPLALCGVMAASAWLSPVPRAGLSAVALLPAYLLLPGALARFWAAEPARRLGARGLAAAVGALAAWSMAAGPERIAGAAAPGLSAGPGPASLPSALSTLAPLGHHTLLAVWIAALLPPALLACRERTGWRWLGLAAGLAGAGAILAGRSLAGCAALAGEALVAALWLAKRRAGAAADLAGSIRWSRRRARLAAWLALLALALALTQAPRLLRVAGWSDPSARARWVYVRAGWEGWRERPWLGWGPGSVGWTAAWFLAPRPGLNPWGEAVGELHSLPIHLAYETGALGLLCSLGIVIAFARARRAERRTAADPMWLAAGGLGLAGAGIAWLATASLAVAALPWAMATAAAVALAGGAATGDRRHGVAAPGAAAGAAPQAALRWSWAPPSGAAASPAGFKPALWAYGLVAATALLALQVARGHYDRAVRAGQAGLPGVAAAELSAAVRLDPAMPLYRLRLALLQGAGDGSSTSAPSPGGPRASEPLSSAPRASEPPPPSPRGLEPSPPSGGSRAFEPSPPAMPSSATPTASGVSVAPPPGGAELALRAARDGRGIGLLWLAAGVLGRAKGEMWTAAAFEQACVQDPFGPYPPFYLMALQPAAAAAPRLGARALLAEPRLAAATFWEGREALFRSVLDAVRRWPGLDNGWKVALLRAAPAPVARCGAVRRLALAIDAAGFSQSTSLHLFRRLPWPALWPLVAVREDLLSALSLPPATTLADTAARPLESGHCDPELTDAQ